jgi:hypothetical protein
MVIRFSVVFQCRCAQNNRQTTLHQANDVRGTGRYSHSSSSRNTGLCLDQRPTASLVIGQTNFTTATCATSQQGECNPVGVAFDRCGNAWVADGNNSRLLEYRAPFYTGEAASLVIGQSSFMTNTCATTRTGMCAPSGIVFDRLGNPWIPDLGNKSPGLCGT